MRNWYRGLFTLMVMCSLVCTSAWGTEIRLQDKNTLQDSGWSILISSETLNQNDFSVAIDSITQDAVIIEFWKAFYDPLDPNELFTPITIDFKKRSTTATPKIIINDEHITNLTGVAWYDFHMFLYPGANLYAGFDPDPALKPNGHLFSSVDYVLSNDPQENGYNNLPIEIKFWNGTVPDSDVFEPGKYAPPSGGGQITIVTNPNMPVGRIFGLKEIPSVPEPVTLLMLLLGGLGIARWKK